MVGDYTAHRCARQGMMSGEMSYDSADDGALQAAGLG
jgi:hypothetical protein